MIILSKPYVSDFLVETIKKNNFKVLDNEVARQYFDEKDLLSDEEAKTLNEPIYSNSENSIEWVGENLPESEIYRMIGISKNKVEFRKVLKTIYPNYYFEELSYDEVKTANPDNIKFPVILKPSVGFLSFGVYPIKNKTEWTEVVSKLDEDIEKFRGIFPSKVVNTSKFIVEELIEGDEFAVDGYFDENGQAEIFNIFQHPFFNDKDVSDRAYFTSKKIMQTYLEKFQTMLNKVAAAGGYKNFPFHLELRANEREIIPIELNPMRLCGWCITDIAYYSWGVNVYECIFKNIKPNWKEILQNAGEEYFYFTIGDIPAGVDRAKIKSINFVEYEKNMSEILDMRKIDYKINPIFAIVFAKCKDISEIKNILELDMNRFIEL